MTLAVEAVAVAMYSHQRHTRCARWHQPLPSSQEGSGPRHTFPSQWAGCSPLPGGISSNKGRSPFFLSYLVAWEGSKGGAGSLNPWGCWKHTSSWFLTAFPVHEQGYHTRHYQFQGWSLFCFALKRKKHLVIPFRAKREASLSSAG